MIAAIYFLNDKSIKSLLALIFTTIACGLISFNYFTEATLILALIRDYMGALDPIITLFAVTNPPLLFWVIEMWGYGLLGRGYCPKLDWQAMPYGMYFIFFLQFSF
jgi:hypothetical protein